MNDYKAQHKWAKNNPEKIREIARKYRITALSKIKANAKRYRLKHPDRVKAQKQKWDVSPKGRAFQKISAQRAKEKHRPFMNELKNRPCMDCHNSFPPECMDFDHVRGEKVNNPGTMYTWSREKLLTEVAKCDLVCSNCHRIRTFSRKRNNDSKDSTIQNQG